MDGGRNRHRRLLLPAGACLVLMLVMVLPMTDHGFIEPTGSSSSSSPDELQPGHHKETSDASTHNHRHHLNHAVTAGSSSALEESFPLLKRCATALEGAEPTISWADVRKAVQADSEPFGAEHIKRHLDAINALLEDRAAVECYQRLWATLLQSEAACSTRVFLDLGSRQIDSTTTFLQHYPTASSFDVFCFEANPTFNRHYPPFIRRHPNVRYHNLAVGVQNTSLFLSSRSIGSSVLDAKHGVKTEGQTVPVIHFSEFLATDLGEGVRTPPRHCPGSYTVMKMDIEKMEYAVLHQMLRTGTVFLLREFLLECHYTTNHPRSRRNVAKDVGMDDCVALVNALPRLSPLVAELHPKPLRVGQPRTPGQVSALEVVLWNDKKTSRRTGARYMERHGGFFPT